MNNLSSYCGLSDARMRASEKELPVCRQKWLRIESGLNFESVVATQLEKFKQEPIMPESYL